MKTTVNVSILVMASLFAACLATLLCPQAMAQDADRHHLELGAGPAVYGVIGWVGGPSHSLGVNVFGEYRYDIAEHFDIGANIGYKFNVGTQKYVEENRSEKTDFHQPELRLVFDYNICPRFKVWPYISVLGGMGVCASKNRVTSVRQNSCYGVVGPRIGVQFGKHCRLSLDLEYALGGRKNGLDPDLSSKSLNFSWVF